MTSHCSTQPLLSWEDRRLLQKSVGSKGPWRLSPGAGPGHPNPPEDPAPRGTRIRPPMDPTPPARGSCSSGGLHPDNDEELCGQKASQLPGFFRKSKRNSVGLAPACADPLGHAAMMSWRG